MRGQQPGLARHPSPSLTFSHPLPPSLILSRLPSRCAANNPGSPVIIVNAGAISPLVTLLGNGTLEVKTEAAGALMNLSLNSPSTQLAIATALVALLGAGTAEAQV